MHWWPAYPVEALTPHAFTRLASAGRAFLRELVSGVAHAFICAPRQLV